MPESELLRMVAVVPRCRSPKSFSRLITTTACDSSFSVILSTTPTGRPPTRTWLPFTSWPPLENVAVTL